MTAPKFIRRALVATAFLPLVSGTAFAQSSWDIDACSGGTKVASGYTNCAAASGTTIKMDVTPYAAATAGSNFVLASINMQPSYIGITSSGEGTGSPNHAIDNYAPGAAYEAVLLKFSSAVDLSSLTAYWANDTGGNSDFEVRRWTGGAAPSMTTLNPNSMSSWVLAKTGDFNNAATGGLTQSIVDGNQYSSYWLVSTAFGGSNDAFKLGSVVACTSQSGGVCGSPPGNNNGGGVPEPTSLALFAAAAFGAGAARRRAKGAKA